MNTIPKERELPHGKSTRWTRNSLKKRPKNVNEKINERNAVVTFVTGAGLAVGGAGAECEREQIAGGVGGGGGAGEVFDVFGRFGGYVLALFDFLEMVWRWGELEVVEELLIGIYSERV